MAPWSIGGEPGRHLAGALRTRPGELIVVVDDADQEHGVRVALGGAGAGDRVDRLVPARHRVSPASTSRSSTRSSARWTRWSPASPRSGAAVIRPIVAAAQRQPSRPGAGGGPARALGRDRARGRRAGPSRRVPAVRAAGRPAGARWRSCRRARVSSPAWWTLPTPLARLELDPARPAALVIGPEGGLASAEADRLRDAGAEPVHLGPRVLPARRAAAVRRRRCSSARAGDLDTALPAHRRRDHASPAPPAPVAGTDRHAGAPLRVAVTTLGCKVNYAEMADLAGQLAGLGCEVVPEDEPADVRVLNSCAVTLQADATTRQRLHRLRRRDPGCHLILTGCSVDANPDRYLTAGERRPRRRVPRPGRRLRQRGEGAHRGPRRRARRPGRGHAAAAAPGGAAQPRLPQGAGRLRPPLHLLRGVADAGSVGQRARRGGAVPGARGRGGRARRAGAHRRRSGQLRP